MTPRFMRVTPVVRVMALYSTKTTPVVRVMVLCFATSTMRG